MGVAAPASVTDLHNALKTDPNDTRALLRLAEQEAKLGHAAVACETYSRAGDIFVRQGFARRALSSFAQALTIAREGALVDRVQPLGRAMGKLYLQEKLVRDAVTLLDSAARWLIERGFDANALPLLLDRIAIDDSEVARVRLAETYFRMGEPMKGGDELVAVFERLRKQGRRDEALDVAERLLGQRPHVPIALASAQLYLARKRHGDPFHALAKLRICCEDDPTSVPTLELLASAFDLAGHGDKAARVRREIAILNKPVGAKESSPPPRISPAPPPIASAAPPRASAVPPRPSSVPPRASTIRPKVVPAKAPAPKEDSIDCAWDELIVEADEREKRIDPSRASFWPVDEGPAPDRSGSVVSVSLADVELVERDAPVSSERPGSLLETALECIESLIAQGRYNEASVLVVRHLSIRPKNPLLLERKAEIEEMLNALHEGPPPALFGLAPRPAARDSQRSIDTKARARAS
jgi:tetratricopeptide (TPR) repeat protein